MKRNSNNSSACRVYGILFLTLLLCIPVCYADFVVHLKDGTSRRVTKMEFRGEKTYLFLDTGMTTSVRTDSIDYRNMALKRPNFLYGFSVDGIRVQKIEQVEVKTGPSQEELRSQWHAASQKALAIRPAGSIGKGETVHIVNTGRFSTTVIVHDRKTNTYRRIVLSEEIFQDNFELRTAKKADAKSKSQIKKPEPIEEAKDPEPVQLVPPKKIPAPAKPPAPSMWVPLGMSFGLLSIGFASTILLSSTQRRKDAKKK
jgi:hypothetical protein